MTARWLDGLKMSCAPRGCGVCWGTQRWSGSLRALLLGPDEEAERARRRDAAERELAGMDLRWTRTDRLDRPEQRSGCDAPGGRG
jgi:hypothetical protein